MLNRKLTRSLISLGTALTLVGVPTLASAQRHDNFYNGVRDGGRGGYYDNGNRGDRYHGDRGRYDDHRGGIGPGKGALIGGAGGAALGAVFGGGLKGTIIGGAAGAGIGAIAGKAHQNNQRRDDYYRR
jgi:hypothetical protein